MTEIEARDSILNRWGVSRETQHRLDGFVELLREGAETQNLVSRTTLSSVWHRHIVDSAQLLDLPAMEGTWLDAGAGAGLPGIVIAILSPRPIRLVETRRLRVSFLSKVVDRLGLSNVQIDQSRVEALKGDTVSVLTARALAPLDRLFSMMLHLAGPNTTWLLPKGRTAASELAVTRETWQGDINMHPSLTDPGAAIIVARNISRRKLGR